MLPSEADEDNPFASSLYPDPLEFRDIEHTLAQLEDVNDLRDWDADFIEDFGRRVIKYDRHIVVTARQWAQLQRIKEKHLQ